MSQILKLICENDYYDIDIIKEQANSKEPQSLKIRGPYIVTEQKNGNGRTYIREVMEKSVKDFDINFIKKNRAVGEMNHPTSTDVNYDNACHKITSLKQEDNVWIGESQVLIGTPKGDLLAGLLSNGVQVGISTRGVGNITEKKVVDEYKLITADVVYEPSGPGCFMEGILESKNFMINSHGDIIEVAYEQLEENLSTLEKHSDDKIIQMRLAIKKFLKQF